MSDRSPHVSVVLPIRNGEAWVVAEIERLRETLLQWGVEAYEIIAVDDGSRDDTLAKLATLSQQHADVRVVRHSKPRGLEAASQTGLEKSRGEVVFLQETTGPVRLADLRQLLEISRDTTVVMARAESAARPLDGPLRRRLQASGATALPGVGDRTTTRIDAGIQMIRRPQWQELLRPAGNRRRVRTSRYTSTALAAKGLLRAE